MIDERLRAALLPSGLPVFPNLYTGDALEYLVTNYTMLPALQAGDRPGAARYLVQVHYYLPHKKNPNAVIEALCKALHAAGFTAPSVQNAADGSGQHYVLECEKVLRRAAAVHRVLGKGDVENVGVGHGFLRGDRRESLTQQVCGG